jgi:hypothetical protein
MERGQTSEAAEDPIATRPGPYRGRSDRLSALWAGVLPKPRRNAFALRTFHAASVVRAESAERTTATTASLAFFLVLRTTMLEREPAARGNPRPTSRRREHKVPP